MNEKKKTDWLKKKKMKKTNVLRTIVEKHAPSSLLKKQKKNTFGIKVTWNVFADFVAQVKVKKRENAALAADL